ncbi:hypothetical protein F4818DRAFT_10630 [Hypoxylon cercidicola]|nr:hypothetical protein F4818DRAFT_10630 [Hypoxylon cercidicola]
MMYTKALLLAALTASACAQMPALLPRKTTATSDTEETSSPECLSRIQSWAGAVPTPAPALQDALNDDANGGLAESGVAGLCDFGSSLPKAQASAFTSYNLDMYSYLSAQSSNLVALASTCSDDMGAPPRVITSQLAELLTVYSSFSAGACKVEATTTEDATTTTTGKSTITASSSSSATVKVGGATTVTSTAGSSDAVSSSMTTSTIGNPTASASNAANSAASSTSSSATPTQNAGARETALRAVAALAVGFVGAAVAL